MSAATRTPPDQPGTNVRGGASGASWRLLLPSPAPRRTAIVGSPSPEDIGALRHAGGSVEVFHRRGRSRRQDHDGATKGGGRPAATAVDAVVVLGDRGIRMLRSPRVVDAVRARCSDDTVVYVQRRARDASDLVDLIAGPIRERLRIGITRRDLRWAAPGDDAAAVRAARALGTTTGDGLRARAGRIAHAVRAWVAPDPDVAELRSGADIGRPPRYLRDAAAVSGIPLDGRRWALAIPGLYASNKAVFLVFPETGNDPELVIKVARSPAQNPRLENEAAALQALARTRWIDRGSAPRALFAGDHAGIAILGETALTGDPFRRRTTAEADCPFAAAVVERLIALGEETATAGASGDLADRMLDLLERYRRAYRPDERVEAFLREGIDAIGAAGTIPFVFQHGDPGTWNILVAPDGTIGFLDWEAADPTGVLLWDLYYFLRSFAVTVSRARGTEDALAGIRRELFAASELSDVLADATRRARERIGVPASLLEPLFVTCWMHRAVKQASRLEGSRLRRGHYHRLLTAAVEERRAPGLRRLYGDG
jgi:hypothetical protein